VVVADALHFFEQKEDELVEVVVAWLDEVFRNQPKPFER
jgi:hypothetical protein